MRRPLPNPRVVESKINSYLRGALHESSTLYAWHRIGLPPVVYSGESRSRSLSRLEMVMNKLDPREKGANSFQMSP